MKKTEEKTKQKKLEKMSESLCSDSNCHLHGSLKVRGRFFEGIVAKKFTKRVVIEFERMVYIRKYERYKRARTKIHARLTDCMKDLIKIGDHVRVQECRPLSKIIHFVVIKKIKEANENGGNGK